MGDAGGNTLTLYSRLFHQKKHNCLETDKPTRLTEIKEGGGDAAIKTTMFSSAKSTKEQG